jgi:hypothetical protein
MRFAALGLAGVILAAASLPAAAQSTTRIEPRPFYGAVVTMEEGVRVFRPLPPHDHIIVNPDKTPISFQLGQSNTYVSAPTYVRTVEGFRAGSGGAFFPLLHRHVRQLGGHPASAGHH